MCVFLSLFFLPNPLNSRACNMGDRPDHLGNFNTEKNTYMVGIPLSPSTMYVDNPNDNRINAMQNDIATRKRSNTSFQITSVTVQGSRTNTEDFEDSADDFEESHTDDISSDILDSSKFTEPDGYHSEDNTNPNIDDLSPCGPLIITPLSPNAHEPPGMNVGLGIGISSTFPTIGSTMVNTGVTMMTSNLESPVSAQVPMINPLPDNWQHRFKVVKIVSSEPFKRGRWRCMDFKDPPSTTEHDNNHVPAIHVTPSSRDDKRESAEQLNVASTVAHVFEIPVSGAYTDAVPVYTQPVQQFYGIFLPPNNNNNNYGETPQPACVDNVVSAAADVNFNRIAPDDTAQLRSHSHPILFQANQMPCVAGSSMSNVMFTPQFAPYNNNNNNNNNNIPRDNQTVNGHDIIPNQVPLNNGQSVEGDLVRSNSLTSTPGAITDKPASRINSVTEDTESRFCSLACQLSLTSGLSQSPPTTSTQLNVVANGEHGCLPRAPGVAAIPAAPVTASTAPPTTAPVAMPSAVAFEQANSAASSGSNTVAIDNKIEQAMDLVKSHLMFAVREEVEVLKEKITELLDRISQLEHENDILRANASPETLKQLNQSQKKFTVQQGSPHIQNLPPTS